MIQEITISLSVVRFTALMPRARPTPSTAPTRVWVVEMGRPSFVARMIVIAAPNSAQKPRVGVSWVILRPIVSITRHPQVASPTTMPIPPSASTHKGTGAFAATLSPPASATDKTADIGPIAFATSFAPWANATKQALRI